MTSFKTTAAELRTMYRNRRSEIAEAIRSKPGDSYEKIGRQFGITRERVRQIAVLYGLERRKRPERIDA